jgi:tRNA-modifying protein YgfZ
MERTALFAQHIAWGGVPTEYYGWEIPAHYGDPLREYAAARTGAGLLDRSAWGRLALTGRDRAALLHRMSTNVVEGLQPGQGTATVLTSPTARIIERLILYVQGDRLLALTSPQNRGHIAQYLRGFVFWQDEVSIKDVGGEWGLLTLVGPTAAATVQATTGIVVSDLAHHYFRVGTIANTEIIIARTDPVAGDAFNVLAPTEQMEMVWDMLVQAGACPIGLAAWEILRVEAGIPAYGHELSEKVTPLDAGLLADINFNKGCYTGQEVVARMYNYEKMPKGLFGLRLSQPLAPGHEATVMLDGKPVGEVTSSVLSPSLGPIALAILRRAQISPGSVVSVIAADQQVTGQIVELPFVAEKQPIS